MTAIKIAILASGAGSNAEVLLCEARAYYPSLEIVAVFTDNPSAGVIARATQHATPLWVIPLLPLPGQSYQQAKQRFEEELLARLHDLQVQWLFLAGFRRILSAEFLQHFWQADLRVSRVVNIHPSLLPLFPGKDAYAQAFNAGVQESGITLHFVDAGIDSGPIIAQEKFPRLSCDDFPRFCARGLQVEHLLYPRLLGELAKNGTITPSKEGPHAKPTL